MTSVRIPITDREMEAIIACWALYEAEYENATYAQTEIEPDDYVRTMAALARLKSKWYKAKDAADARSVMHNTRKDKS